jgi:hypothetical protein
MAGTTFYSSDRTTPSCQIEAQQLDQTIAQERNHNHGSPLGSLLLPSNPQAHRKPAKSARCSWTSHQYNVHILRITNFSLNSTHT